MPRTNFYKDPIFARTSGTIDIGTNLALNPSFEGISGSVELARNYFVNPGGVTSFGFDPNSGVGTGNTVTTSNVDASWSLSGKAFRTTWSVVGSPNDGDVALVVGTTFSPGKTVTLRMKSRSSRSGISRVPLKVYSEENGVANILANSRTTNNSTSDVIVDWVTFVVPPIADTQFWVYMEIDSKLVGDYVEVSEIDMYEGSYQPKRPWFSGEYAPVTDSDITKAWAGPANNSSSILRGTGVSGTLSGEFDRGVVISSTNWASTGTSSARLFRLWDGSSNSFIQLLANWLPGFTANKVYGIRLKVRLDKPFSGTASTLATRQILIQYNSAAGSRYLTSPQFPNTAGIHEIYWVVTIPSNATALEGFRVYSGYSSGDMWIDDVLVVTADNELDCQVLLNRGYWGGTYTSDSDFTSRHSGSANNSTSIISAKELSSIQVDGARAIQSTRYVSPGEYSMRLMKAPNYASEDAMAYISVPSEMINSGSIHCTITNNNASFQVGNPIQSTSGSGRKALSWNAPLISPREINFTIASEDDQIDDAWFSHIVFSNNPQDSGEFFYGGMERKVRGDGYIQEYSWLGEVNNSPSVESAWFEPPYLGIRWNLPKDKIFETGIDHGVLYIDDVAVPWNGLVSATIQPNGGETVSYYLDGVKRLNHSEAEDFEGELEAYTAPREFLACDGQELLARGFYSHQQYRKPFSMIWRTIIGNGIMGIKFAYKIHILYNAVVSPSNPKYETLSDDSEPEALTWTVTASPVSTSGGFSSYFTLNSQEVGEAKMREIESILFGSADIEAQLILPDEIATMIES